MILVFISLTSTLILDTQIHFVKVENVTLDTLEKILWKKKRVLTDICAEKCFSDKTCLSFEYKKITGRCYFIRESVNTNLKLKSAQNIDYYQRIKCNYTLCFIINFLTSFSEICDFICTT